MKTTNEIPDAEEHSLVERIKNGELDLFATLVQPHERGLRLTSYSILQNEADAEEVVQETKLRALAHLDQLRDNRSFRSWLFQIAVNEARMRLRRDRIYDRSAPVLGDALSETSEDHFVPRDFAEWHEDPFQVMERKELWASVGRALRTMEPIYREVFVLRDMRHLSVSETAVVLSVSEATVNTRLHRARLQMREHLAPALRRPAHTWAPVHAMMDMAYPYMRKMMGCDQVVRRLSLYIDGELAPADRARIERHLRFCHRCALLLDTSRKLLYLVGDESVLLPPFSYRAPAQPASAPLAT